MKGHWKEKLFGDKQFYKMVLLIAVPIYDSEWYYQFCKSAG